MDADRRAAALFVRRFGEPPALLARAPGRVNLMGDHTDYNDGFVLPVALERSTWIAARPRADDRVVCHSEGYPGVADFPVARPDDTPSERDGWSRYLEGVGWALAAAGAAVGGWDGAVASDVPAGAGLSSSAAFEMAAARIYVAAGGGAWDPIAAARAGRRAENEWVGIPSGIMDQLISAAAAPGHALLIDCRSLAVEPVPLPPATTVFVLDTATRRDLSSAGYDDRQQECMAAADALGLVALRDLSESDLAAGAEQLGPHLEARARHVVTENARTVATARALRSDDREQLGAQMAASHRSLRDDFEISTPAIEAMVRAAVRSPGCIGARITGGGFGGSAVALVDSAAADDFAVAATARYRSATGLTAAVYATRGGTGASLDHVP